MKNLKTMIFAFGIFAGGVFLGKQMEKTAHRKTIHYSGSLDIEMKSGEVFLSLNRPPEDLENLADVIFKVNKI